MNNFTAICRSIVVSSLLFFSANSFSNEVTDQAPLDNSVYDFATQDHGFIERKINKPKDFIDMETWIKSNYAEATVSPIFYFDPLSVHSYQIPAGLNMGKYAVAFETYEFGKKRLNALAEGKNSSLVLDTVDYPTEQQIENIIQKKSEKRISSIIKPVAGILKPYVGQLLKYLMAELIINPSVEEANKLCSKYVSSSSAKRACYDQALKVCKGGVMAIYQTTPTCMSAVRDRMGWKVQPVCNVQCLEYK